MNQKTILTGKPLLPYNQLANPHLYNLLGIHLNVFEVFLSILISFASNMLDIFGSYFQEGTLFVTIINLSLEIFGLKLSRPYY